MQLLHYIAFVLTSVAFLPSLEGKLNDCFDVEGILVPVMTPMDDNDELALDVIPQYAQYLRDKGVNGVIVAATTGEGSTLNVSDNKKLLDAWMEAAPPLNLFVISSVGGVPLPDTLEIARYSEELGVDALFAKPEVYYKPKNAEELVYNMELIAKAAPETPLVYDDIPEYTGVVVDIVKFYELAEERINTFRGLKSNVFDNLLKLRTKTKGQQKLYSSDITYLAPSVFLGFNNFALAELNFFPKVIIDTINIGRRGNLTRSTNLYQRVIDLINLIIKKGNRIAAYKAAMPLLTGIEVGEPREPIYPLSENQKINLENRLRYDGKVRIIKPQTSFAE